MNKVLYFLTLILFIVFWAFFVEPEILTVKHYKFHNEKLKGTRIVFAADFHIAEKDEKRLQKIVKKINSQKPDIVLLGGDFVNGQEFEKTLPIEKIAANLADIKAKYGIFSVLGNHDRWLDAEKITQELEKYKITVLANESQKVNTGRQKIYIAGTEDLMTGEPDIDKALLNTKSPVILMTHSPDIFPRVPKQVDLTLAGHTHGGQVILPFFGSLIVPSDFGNKYAEGLIVEDGKKMIVSKGLGTSIIPVRFNCPPEIVVIDFD